MDDEEPSNREEKLARESLQKLFGFANDDGREDQECGVLDPAIPSIILPRQASYAGSNPAQESVYQTLSEDCRAEIPTNLWKAFGLEDGGEDDDNTNLHSAGQASPQQHKGRRLYSHQVAAIEAAMANQHCSLCTGTGSGKSLAFLLVRSVPAVLLCCVSIVLTQLTFVCSPFVLVCLSAGLDRSLQLQPHFSPTLPHQGAGPGSAVQAAGLAGE